MSKVYKNKKDLVDGLIRTDDSVLDVGFLGQGTSTNSSNWVNRLLRERASEVWGIDLDFDESKLPIEGKYIRASAESFDLAEKKFDVIFAGDLIEHLINPGLFLSRSKAHLKEGGRLILTTPNCFNLFNIAEKFSKGEPTVNPDHTCYFNDKTLRVLLAKCGLKNIEFGYLYTLGCEHKESIKKKFLNALYLFISKFTSRYLETLVVVIQV